MSNWEEVEFMLFFENREVKRFPIPLKPYCRVEIRICGVVFMQAVQSEMSARSINNLLDKIDQSERIDKLLTLLEKQGE